MGNNHGRYFDGFLMGLLVGGTAIFLLGTKKGNKLLKILTEEGLDGLGGMIENLEEKKEEEKSFSSTKPHIESPSSNGIDNSNPPHARRFFRRNK